MNDLYKSLFWTETLIKVIEQVSKGLKYSTTVSKQ